MEIIVYQQKVTEYLELILWLWFAFDEACLGYEEFTYYLWLLLNHMMAIKERDFR